MMASSVCERKDSPLPLHNYVSLSVHGSVTWLQFCRQMKDVAGVEALLASHKDEIDACQDSFTNFKRKAEAVIAAGLYASREVWM